MRAKLKTSRTWLAFSLTAMSFAVAAVVHLALTSDARVAKALRTPGAILAVTRGSEPLVLGAVWQTMAGNAVPALRDKVGGIWVTPVTTKATSLVIWQHLSRDMGWSGPPPLLQLELIGDDGQVLKTNAWGELHSAAGKQLPEFEIANYPRRGKQVRIRFLKRYPGAPDQPDIVVPNPAAGGYPVWRPTALPATERMDSLEVTLARFTAGTHSEDGTVAYDRTALRFHVREQGRPADNAWAVEKTRITDPTGNSWESAGSFISERNGIMVDAEPLLVEEPAYRVEVELARVDNFPPQEVCRIGNLRFPASGQVMRLSRVAKLQGCTVELTHLLGAAAKHDLGWSGGGATAAVRIVGPAERYCLRNASSEHRGYSVFKSIAANTYCVTLGDLAPGAPFSLKLALTPRRRISFLAHVSPVTEKRR